MSNEDRRLLLAILSAIHGYDYTLDNLWQLEAKIGSSWYHLQTEESWVEQIKSASLDLDTIYSIALDQNQAELTSADKTLVSETLENLKTVLNSVLIHYFQSSDPNITTHAKILDPTWLLCPHCIDAWESTSPDAMVVCPKCDQAMHNPRFI